MDNPIKSDERNELRPILNQSRVESQMLSLAQQGLTAALDWQTEGGTFTRKLSTLRFAAQTYQDHLERVLALEEHDGYMDVVLEECPHYDGKVNALRQEHDDFRQSLSGIVAKLDRLLPTDLNGLEEIRKEIQNLLAKIRSHSERETSLLQDSVLTDFGAAD